MELGGGNEANDMVCSVELAPIITWENCFPSPFDFNYLELHKSGKHYDYLPPVYKVDPQKNLQFFMFFDHLLRHNFI